jgi:hypothetical protein
LCCRFPFLVVNKPLPRSSCVNLGRLLALPQITSQFVFFHNQQMDFALRHKELKTQVKNKARRTQAIKRKSETLIWALE